MKTRSKLFAALGIDWRRWDDFQRAIAKLTLVYTLVIFLLLNLFTGLLYWVIEQEEQKHIDAIEEVWQKKHFSFSGNAKITIVEWQETQDPDTFSREEMLDFQSILLTVIRKKIFLIELLVLFLGALGSYFLAKRTLLPIQSKSEQQKRFLADVNHELKNPLAALKTTLEVSLQQKDWTSGELKALFGDLKGEVERLSGMTQDLLYLERANAPMSPQELDVGNIIEEVIHSLSPLAKEKNIFFTRDIPSLTVWGRSEDLKKVFYNLIHNAIKFSYPNGEISLSCPKKRSVVIKDFGSGIDKKDIPHIFERFYKADDSRTFSNENGSGLGLSIVKKICDENSWGISVKSEKGSGTAFSVWF